MISFPLRQKLKPEAAFLFLLILAAALFLSNLGAFKDFVRSESYFALGARLMVAEGNWLAPHSSDEPVLDKPPLQYWLIGVTYASLGSGYATARLPSALAALAVLAVLYLLGTKLYDRRTGLLCVGCLATSYLFYTFARTAMSDMVLTLCVTSALSCFILTLTNKNVRWSGLLTLCAYIFIALGILAKGPVAVVLVAGPLLCELLFSRDLTLLKRLRIFSGAFIILIIAVPYFLLLYLKLGPEPLQTFFIGENLKRFTGEIYAHGARPVWHLPIALIGDFAPWSLLLFPSLYLDWRERRAEPEERRARRLIYFWLFFPLVFFSLSRFKVDYYLLPAMPAAALITSSLVERASEFPGWARAYIYTFTILFALVMIGACVVSLNFAAQLRLNTSYLWLPVATFVAAPLFILYSLRKHLLHRAVWSLVFFIWLVLCLHEWTLTPALSRYQPIERLAASIPMKEARVYTSPATNDWANTLAFHLPAGQTVMRIASDADDAQLKEILEHDPRAVVLLKDEEFERLLAGGVSMRQLAEGETLGDGGLSLKLLRRPKLERLKIVERQTKAGE